MDTKEAKVAGMICLGLGTLGVGLAPAWFSAHSRQWPLLLSILLCFGGGVLFSTSLIHILPELRESTDYAEHLLCAGFFLLYFIDEIVHYFWSDTHEHKREIGNRRSSISKRNYGTTEQGPLINNEGIYVRQNAYNYQASCSEIQVAERPRETECHVSHTEPCNNPPIGQLGLLIALSLHAILEGLAVGLEQKASKVSFLKNYCSLK